MTQPTITPDQWEQILAIARQAAQEIAAEQEAAARRPEIDPPAPDPVNQSERAREAERGFAARLAAVLRARR